MSQKKQTAGVTDIAKEHLGSTEAYKSYEAIDPKLLVPIPRALSRSESNITVSCFDGYDVWNAFEFSALRNDGFPVIARLKLVYDASSEHIVESKSLKLYLHSFNFAMLGKTTHEVIANVKAIVSRDLSEALGVNVYVGVFTSDHKMKRSPVNRLPFVDLDQFVEHRLLNGKDIKVADAVKHSDKILQTREGGGAQFFTTNSMRSNCRVTHQPDWATAFIAINSQHKVEEESLLRYILSMRKEDHFHEEACELLFNDLFKVYKPSWLAVVCLYTRRGGIDINPVRFCGEDIADPKFRVAESLTTQYFRQ